MNSRERVRTALNRKAPDKVPIDFGGNQSSIHVKAYKKLLEYLGIEDKNIKYAEFLQQIAYPCEEVLNRFQVDTRYIRPLKDVIPIKDMKLIHEGKYLGVYDQFGVFWGNDASKSLDEILYNDPVIHPLENFTSVQEINGYNWPDGREKTPFQGLKEIARKLKEKTEYAISTSPIGCVFEYTTFLFGFTKVLRYLRTKPELITATMEHLLKYWIEYDETFLKEVGPYLDVVCVNGDLAEQAGPIMNVKIYEQLIKPMERKLSERIHQLANVKINYHCCGSTPQFIPHWAEIGYDVCNPVQISAHDMEPCSLKKRFGKIISFWGGLCNTTILAFGTPEQIDAEVKRNMQCLQSGGGYIAANIHNITAEVPPQNVVAMFDAAIKYRGLKQIIF